MSLSGSKGNARRSSSKAKLQCEHLEQRQMMDASFQFDFGTATSPVAAGFTQVQLSTYTPTTGFGWESLKGMVARDFPLAGQTAVRRDVHIGVRNTFLLDLPNGTYDVTPTLGNPRAYADNVSIFLEGQKVGRVSTRAGQFVEPTYRVTVTDGQLNFRLVDGSGKGPWFGIAGLTITPVETAPTPPPPTPEPPPPPPPPPAPGAPTANAGLDLISDEAKTVQFGGTASGGTGALSYGWDFGDGTTATGTLTPTHTYADSGNYTVTLKVTDANGLVGQDTALVSVNNLAPTATFGNSGPAGEGSPVTFSFTNPADPSSVDANAGFKYSYDFDNNGTFDVVDSTSASQAFAFADNGAYTVKGRIKDKDGGFTTYTTTVTISNVAPTASHNGPYTGTTGQAVTFNGSATDPGSVDAGSLTFSWTFGDGTTSNQAKPTHTYATKGSYNVTFTATDKDGAKHTVATTTTISDPAPTPPPGSLIITPYDKIPNFGLNPTIVSAASGNWSDPNTWSLGRIPVAGDVVAISTNTTVTYDVVSDVKLNTITVHSGGLLTFRTDVSTRVIVQHFLVLEGGELRVGTAANPVAANVKAEIIFANVAIDTNKDPAQYGNGLIGLGKVTMHGAVKTDTFIRLAAAPKAGDTTLTLAAPATGWKVGDRLFIPDSRQVVDPPVGYVPQSELVTISAISADGKTITLAAAVAYNHPGAFDAAGNLDFLPHVANLTRNVVVKSESATGTRGHVFFTHKADVDVRYVTFGGLGRTTWNPIDDTTFNSSGAATHIGTNQSSRLPVNFHHVSGPASPQANGHQFTFMGNAVTCPLNPMPFIWGINLNDSHKGLVKDNVLYNWAGAGLMTQNGSQNNVIERNYVGLVIFGNGASRADSGGGREGVGYWLQDGTNNTIRNNVAANTLMHGFNFYGGGPFKEFSGNEVYGGRQGMTIWDINGSNTNNANPNAPQSTIKNFVSWHNWEYGVGLGYPAYNVTFDGLVVRGANGVSGTGWSFGDYRTRNLKIKNADIQGMRIGIVAPMVDGGDPFTIENSILRNGTNVLITMQAIPGGGGWTLAARDTIIRSVKFDGIAGAAATNIEMAYGPNANGNVVLRDRVFVYDYNQVAGDNFRVYYTEQKAAFVVPQTDPTVPFIGSPEAGLTNLENWNKYGIAVAGEIAPSGATTRTGIIGLVM